MDEDDEIARSVADHGWHAIGVDDHAPPFIYTIGLMYSYRHPEFILFGLETTEGWSVLAAMVEDIQAGKSFNSSQIYEGVLRDFPVTILPVHPTQHEIYLGHAMAYCRRKGEIGALRAVQVFWPDCRGHFP